MKRLLPILLALLAILSPIRGEEASPPPQDSAPRWKFLGDDEDLRRTIAGADQVLFVCVYQTALEEVQPPFAKVVLSATVVKPLKGTHAIGDKIHLSFHSDSLPEDPAERDQFIAAAAERNLGSLKIAFLKGEKAAAHSCEWLDIAPYSAEMLKFVKENRDAKPEADQDGRR